VSTFKEIYNYREMLKSNVKKDIRGKYKGSVLGILWSFLNPLLQVIVYWIIFPYLFRGATIPNYLCYLVTGIIPWNFFTNVVNLGTISIKSNAGIIKKVYFPREVLLISQVLSGLVNFFISCVIIVLFCIGTGAGVSVHILWLPLIALIQAAFSFGIILFLSAFEVYVQDVEYIVSFILNMAFYGTPILYSLELFKSAGTLYRLVSLNPLTKIINAYRDIFLYHVTPDLHSLLIVAILALILILIGYRVFKKLEKGFAEVL
jgi:lipopolysaccharide transport system permease protein